MFLVFLYESHINKVVSACKMNWMHTAICKLQCMVIVSRILKSQEFLIWGVNAIPGHEFEYLLVPPGALEYWFLQHDKGSSTLERSAKGLKNVFALRILF